jgi:hypothetical protein
MDNLERRVLLEHLGPAAVLALWDRAAAVVQRARVAQLACLEARGQTVRAELLAASGLAALRELQAVQVGQDNRVLRDRQVAMERLAPREC